MRNYKNNVDNVGNLGRKDVDLIYTYLDYSDKMAYAELDGNEYEELQYAEAQAVLWIQLSIDGQEFLKQRKSMNSPKKVLDENKKLRYLLVNKY